jgi:hypothetical protein
LRQLIYLVEILEGVVAAPDLARYGFSGLRHRSTVMLVNMAVAAPPRHDE